MRAVRLHGYGGAEVVAVDRVPEPDLPRRDELLVRVAAASINGTDRSLREGRMRVATRGRLPITLGFDLAGEVVACGPRVTAFAVGDRVAALLGHAGGAQADLVLVRQHRVARVPDAVTDLAASAVPLAGLTALQALYDVGALDSRGPRARVLVLGASGGVGAFAVQLAGRSGAHVTGVASASKLDQVRTWGAAVVVGRRETDLAELAAGSEPWDLVLDAHGGARHAQLHGLLRPRGTAVSTRPISADTWRAIAGACPRRRTPAPYRVVTTKPRSADLARLLDLLARGELTAPVGDVLPLTEAATAHTRATAKAGKVVLQL